jgi:hypothetical protein
MLPGVRIEIECGRVCHVASSVVGHDRNVIAYLLLYRPALMGIECIADGDVRCPGDSPIRAPGIE